MANATNILGLIIVSAMFDVTTKAIKEKGIPFLDFFQSSNDIIIKMLQVLICVIALPECFHALEHKNSIDKRITRCVTPLAATIGRSGGAIYISISCIFIMQTVAIDTNTSNVILVILLTWISSLAIPSVTGASLITVLILLTALGIPGESAAMLFALEVFLDRSRTVVNLITQLTSVVVTHHLCADGLPILEDEDDSLSNDANSDTTNSNVTELDLKGFRTLEIAHIDIETGLHSLPQLSASLQM